MVCVSVTASNSPRQFTTYAFLDVPKISQSIGEIDISGTTGYTTYQSMYKCFTNDLYDPLQAHSNLSYSNQSIGWPLNDREIAPGRDNF